MVYLEHSGSKFWRCELTAAKTVTITYGKCGSEGRTMKKTDFKNKKEAEEYVDKQTETKRKGGYEDATDPNGAKSSRGSKRKKTAAAPVAKKAGLKNHAAPDMTEGETEAVVDSGVAGVDSALASRVEVHGSFHAKLALVDTSKNTDKYYIMQLLVDRKNKQSKRGRGRQASANPEYYLFTRWGRTGTGGQAKLDSHGNSEEKAETAFAKIFKTKTGFDWGEAVAGTAPKGGKYEYLCQAKTTGSGGNWYYYLTNDPLGKSDGWYKYDEENAKETEELYTEFDGSGQASRLSTRLVTSESSGFTYKINLQDMTQTNTTSGKIRPIQRTTTKKAPVKKPPLPDAAMSSSAPAVVAGVSPTKKRKAAPPVVASAMSPTKKSGVSRAIRSPAKSVSAPVAGTVDASVSSALQSGSVYGEYDVMLNQTNLAQNNNKFYKIQLVQTSAGVHLFTRWGRVGEDGATQEVGPMDSDKAIKEFQKKFKAKSANNWDDRDDFKPKKGKYTIVEMEEDAEAAEEMSKCAAAAGGGTAKPAKVLPCTLDPTTKGLVDLIFNEDMFKTAMTKMNLDPAKLPLGALSTAQIKRGFEALEKLEEELDGNANSRTLMELTSDFYTVIPHAFGRSRGPVLNTKQLVDEKYEMLNTLTDIEAAQAMQKENKKKQQDGDGGATAHPSDLNYQQLATDLTLVGDGESDREVIEQFLANTEGQHCRMKLRDVWRVDRNNESKRFAKHAKMSNRRLLWHGTNVAVVAAILKSGLRIMPHSGGRVGRGIYLADQHEKSAWYTCSARGTVIMFLVEAALGKMHVITQDDSSLIAAPEGFDSVLAKGTKAPPENKDVEIDIDGNPVKVSQGKPTNFAKNSSFAHNEFLIYQESQHRIRYILAFDER